jgi:hypothetical protein
MCSWSCAYIHTHSRDMYYVYALESDYQLCINVLATQRSDRRMLTSILFTRGGNHRHSEWAFKKWVFENRIHHWLTPPPWWCLSELPALRLLGKPSCFVHLRKVSNVHLALSCTKQLGFPSSLKAGNSDRHHHGGGVSQWWILFSNTHFLNAHSECLWLPPLVNNMLVSILRSLRCVASTLIHSW